MLSTFFFFKRERGASWDGFDCLALGWVGYTWLGSTNLEVACVCISLACFVLFWPAIPKLGFAGTRDKLIHSRNRLEGKLSIHDDLVFDQ